MMVTVQARFCVIDSRARGHARVVLRYLGSMLV